MSETVSDPLNSVELGLFSSRIAAICEEMGALLGRVAFSPNIRDRLDYSCALFNRQGQLLGQATHIPVHLGSMAYAMVDLVGSRQWHDGDMLILNDPFRGGTHLPDITLIAPVFSRPMEGGRGCPAMIFVATRGKLRSNLPPFRLDPSQSASSSSQRDRDEASPLHDHASKPI